MADETIEVFIEVPMGSRNKYEWDFERQTFVLDRMLFTAVRYPGDYGFIPDTLALDGDHLDAIVILGEPTFPGCTVNARVLGMLDMSDDKGPDEKILTVADHDPRWANLRFLNDVPTTCSTRSRTSSASTRTSSRSWWRSKGGRTASVRCRSSTRRVSGTRGPRRRCRTRCELPSPSGAP
jgi:inorganic pyrophosphatase